MTYKFKGPNPYGTDVMPEEKLQQRVDDGFGGGPDEYNYGFEDGIEYGKLTNKWITRYEEGDIVECKGKYYRCKRYHDPDVYNQPSNHNFTSVYYWDLLDSDGNIIPTPPHVPNIVDAGELEDED